MLTRLWSRLIERLPDLPLALKTIVGFWLFYFATVVVRALLVGEERHLLDGTAPGILVGILVTFIVYLVLRWAGRETLRTKVIVAAIVCVPASAVYATFNLAFYLYQPLVSRTVVAGGAGGATIVLPRGGRIVAGPARDPNVAASMPVVQNIMRERAPRMIANYMVTWYFFFAAWACFYIAMSSAAQLRTAERRAARFEREAQSAQLRALRYQINPHFLFNTLNSLSSLIMVRRSDEAERMLMNLSHFFRSTLAIDPTDDVTLAQEIAFQMLYLDIEQVRFPDRLRVVTDIPEPLGAAKVPALLLQPIIENAIKYGVARARTVVTLSIAARAEGDRLHLTVANSGDPQASSNPDHGTGVGLANVCERLTARFGEPANCRYGPMEEGGFRVEMSMPLVTDG